MPFVDSSRGVILVTGVDAGQFLQSLISNNIHKSTSDTWLYSLMLTAQGKIISDCFIQAVDNGYLLDCPRSEISTLLTKMRLYRLRSKVEFEETSHHILISPTEGLPDPRHNQLWLRSLLKESRDIPVTDEKEYHLIRMKLLIPDFTMDLTPDKFYPHELDMNNINAIDYTKGCYVGQEVTARIEYRGIVRKKLYLLDIVYGTPEKTNILLNEEKEVGMLLGRIDNIGLGLLRTDTAHILSTANGASLKLMEG